MSEQELIPEPRASQPAADNEQDQASQYYYTPAGKGGKVGPKDVPPASYDEPMIESLPLPDYPGGYAAQNNAASTYQQPGAHNAGRQGRQQQQSRLGPDGDAYQSRYQPNGTNNRQWNVPPWARPQRNRWSAGQIAALVILALLVGIPLLLSLAGIVIGAIFGLLGLALAAFIIIGIPLLIVRSAIRRSLRRSGWRGRPWMGYRPGRWGPFWMGYRTRRRGPWW